LLPFCGGKFKIMNGCMISVEKFCEGRRKYGDKLASTRLHVDRQINPKFIPSPQSMFRLRKKRIAQYPLLTTHEDYNLKYVGSLSKNIIQYDPFKKIPTIKLAKHFAHSLKVPAPGSNSVEKTTGFLSPVSESNAKVVHKQRKHVASLSLPPVHKTANNRQRKLEKKKLGNPFRRHDPSPEQVWLLKRCTP
jgi:hypothetical protein